MALITSSLFERATGSVGGITLSTQKGRIIMRSKPTIVSNPRTDKQQKQRNAMAVIVAIYKLFANILRTGYTVITGYGNKYSMFVKTNIDFVKNKVNLEEAVLLKHLEGMTMSNGKIEPLNYMFGVEDTGICAFYVNKGFVDEHFAKQDNIVLLVGNGDTLKLERKVLKIEDLQEDADNYYIQFQNVEGLEAANAVHTVYFLDRTLQLSSYATLNIGTGAIAQQAKGRGSELADSIQ